MILFLTTIQFPWNYVSVALLLWILWDIIDILFFPKLYVKKQTALLQKETANQVEKVLGDSLANFSLSQFSQEIQKAPYFMGLKNRILKEIKGFGDSPNESWQQLKEKYQTLLMQLVFEEVATPKCKEDLALVDYKLKHQEREISFALYKLKVKLRKNLPKDLEYIAKQIFIKHQKEVELVRKAIQKDQDALPILGMEIPLKKAATVIIGCGDNFNIAGIHPKSLSTIAGETDPEHWNTFCNLIFKASQQKVDHFLKIFAYNPEKGESVPLEFLKHASSWLQKKKDFTLSHMNNIEEYMKKFSSKRRETRREVTRVVELLDEEARKMLEGLTKKHLNSRKQALEYLRMENSADSQRIKSQIAIKRKELNQALGVVTKDKRKKLLVEIHFLNHELAKYLK